MIRTNPAILVGVHFSPTAMHKKVHKQLLRGKYGP